MWQLLASVEVERDHQHPVLAAMMPVDMADTEAAGNSSAGSIP